MDPSTQRLFQRVAEKLGWENPETLDRTAGKELRKSLKSRRLATCSFDEDPSRKPLLSDSDSLEKENQSGNRNARSNRDFNQILADKITPRRACKQISSAKKIRKPIPVFSSDSDDDFEIFLSRVRTPKTQLRQQSVSGCDISLKHFIVDDLSSDDDFVVEKKNPPVSNGKLKHPKTPVSVPRLQKQTPFQYDSLVFLSDSDDDGDIRDFRQGGSTSQPSSQVKETQAKDHKLRGALHFPSPLTTDHTSPPSSALPTCSGRCNDTGSSDDEFLSLLDRIKKKQKLRNTSMQVTPKPPEELKATTASWTPSVKGKKGSDWAPVTDSLVDRTREQLHISRPFSQSEPRTGPSSRMAVCKTSGCFLQSLSITGSVYCCNFKQNKQELTSKLYQLYNTSIFDSKLPTDMSVTWNTKMRKTAGYCITGQERVTGKRYARIELSVKVCDSADRLRDTLVHEMCHAATWLINNVRDGHGPFWKLYARKATLAHPELPVVTRCHSYDINYKYQYQCSRCKNTIGRHSKSLDTQKFVCALCKGQLVLLTVSNPRGPTPFAMFVKENYGAAQQELAGQSHAEVMRKLSADFASKTRLSNS